MSKLNLRDALNNVLDRTDLDDKVLKELKAIKAKVEKLEDQAEAKIEDLLEEPKSFFARLRANIGFWSIIEVGTLAFMALPAWNGDFNIAFGAALVWVLLHKFDKIWIK